MAIQLGAATRNARLNALEVEIGTTPVLTMWTTPQPANCAAANTGTKLVEVTLPSDWMAAASGGTKAILGSPWEDLTADNSGTAVYFRIHKTGGGTCEVQGTVGTGGGFDMTIDNAAIVAGQTVRVTSFTLTEANP